MPDTVGFRISVADMVAELNTRYEANRAYCKDYITEENADFSVSVSDSEIETEMKAYPTPFSKQYCENICLYRAIAEKLPAYDRFVFHGAAVKAFDKGFIFTAPSGTGKTTHISLLMKHFGEYVSIINGDKPILSLADGDARVYSTPWAGKERWHTNTSAPLGGIIILKRGKENRIQKVSPERCFDELMKQVYIPKNGEMMLKTLDMLDKLAKRVDFYVLECDISRAAAETSYKILSQ